MKKIYVFILTFFIGLLIFNGCSSQKSSEPLVNVKILKDYNTAWDYYYYKIKITALENGIQIKNVKVNDGNCKRLAFEGAHIKVLDSKPPKEPLNLGEVLRVRLSPQCNPIKVEVETNKGDWVLRFEP